MQDVPGAADVDSDKPKGGNFDVVIVGLGPVGATLANLLGPSGISTLVLEREDAVFALPRAVHFDDEVMRVFQTIGLAGRIEKNIRVNKGMRFVDAQGQLLLDWPRPQRPGAQGWYPSYRFHQPDLERELRRGLTRFDNVVVRTGCELTHVEDRGANVMIQYKDLSNDQPCSVSAKYIVGCDGSRSAVRRIIDTTMHDYDFHEQWLVVDVLLKRPMPQLGDHTIQYCSAQRPATYARGPGMRRRWEIAVLDGEVPGELVRPENVWALLENWITDADAELERAAVYSFHSLIAKSWRKGRLLIAGDAAHQTPPFMGQGMCAGIRDASNLAWKLVHCVAVGENENLLDSYQSERAPHAKAYIKTAIRLGALINTSDTQDALNVAFRQPDGTTRMSSIAPRLGPGLAAGALSHVGLLAPQLRLADGQLMDDVVAYAHCLIVNGSWWRQLGDLHEKSPAIEVFLLLDDDVPEAQRYLDDLGCKAVLIRPDRYILGTATKPEELRALFGAVL